MINLALALVAATTIQTAPTLEETLETALGTAGLSTRTARFDANLMRFFGHGEFTSPLFDAYHENPWRIPFFADVLRRDFATMSGRPSDSMMLGARMLGFGTRRTLLGNPIAAAEEAAKAPGALKTVLDDMKKQGLIPGAVPDLKAVPAETQRAAAVVLATALRARDYRRLAFAQLGDLAPQYAAFSKGNQNDADPEAFYRTRDAYGKVDLGYLAAGGHDLLAAAQAANVALTVSPKLAYDLEIPTSWGIVRLTGGTDTIHSDRPTFLVIDTGGNDTYINVPSNSGVSNWGSIVLDRDGDDRYLSDAALRETALAGWPERKNTSQKPGPAGALFGYSFLIDAGGSDLYRSHRPAMGSGRLGIATLLDMSGDDTYDAYADSQGFGMFGAGLLEDVSGNDRYEGFSQVQGHGQTMGFGYLVDRNGDDRFIANDQVIDFPSPQSAEHNVSMAQGAANGRRADYLEGHSLSGGLGILFDMNGNDGYSCGVFGQGVGYWKGVGMLWDSMGKDVFLGQWYVQGASAHFAVGYLEDESGDDSYSAPMNMAQGAGHDFSIGWLLDRDGSDTHRAPNLSLGAGNANGIGIYLDMQGVDTYESSGLTLGRAAEAPKLSLRARALTLGVFMDLGGQDAYPPASNWALNATKTANWTDRGPIAAESHVGIFWDR